MKQLYFEEHTCDSKLCMQGQNSVIWSGFERIQLISKDTVTAHRIKHIGALKQGLNWITDALKFQLPFADGGVTMYLSELEAGSAGFWLTLVPLIPTGHHLNVTVYSTYAMCQCHYHTKWPSTSRTYNTKFHDITDTWWTLMMHQICWCLKSQSIGNTDTHTLTSIKNGAFIEGWVYTAMDSPDQGTNPVLSALWRCSGSVWSFALLLHWAGQNNGDNRYIKLTVQNFSDINCMSVHLQHVTWQVAKEASIKI